MHYAITDKILQLFPMHDGARLRFGAVLPDASVNKRKTHFRIYNEKLGIRLYDLESYRAQFGERMQKDDLYLGYYLHLIEDALYRKHCTTPSAGIPTRRKAPRACTTITRF